MANNQRGIAVPHINQHSVHLQRIAQAKMARSLPATAAKKAAHSYPSPPSSPGRNVLQRMEVNKKSYGFITASQIDSSKTVAQDHYVVSQVQTPCATFGHSELFIESPEALDITDFDQALKTGVGTPNIRW